MKNITKSLLMITAVAALAIGGTVAYFSDTETSTGNTITAGIIDIRVDDPTTWKYTITDMKPGYVDYSNFTVKNDGNNPVNVWKKVSNAVTDENGITEPECVAYGGTWTVDVNNTNGMKGTCSGGTAYNNLASVIDYDLSVVVKDSQGKEIWNQTLYNEDKTIAQINAMGGNGTFLGMIPVGGSMEVTESYHMIEEATNKNQSDKMTFDITLYGEQLEGTVVLENKDNTSSSWRVMAEDNYTGTLTYKVKDPEFDYSFTGKAPLANTTYVLAAGYDGGTNVDTYLGKATTDGDGNISFNDSIELGKDMKNVKVWLLPETNWNNGTIVWSQMDKWLWETGLIWYDDTDV